MNNIIGELPAKTMACAAFFVLFLKGKPNRAGLR